MVKSVSIYCSSSDKIDLTYKQAAEELGTILSEAGIRIINGAGTTGLMRTVSDAAIKSGGLVVGVIPRFMVENGWHHLGLTELIQVETMHERKLRMAELSEAAIALPGGCGTLEELLEIITWKQLGLYKHPVVILNTNNYYDPLLEMLHRSIDEHFMQQNHAFIWKVAKNPVEAVELIYQGEKAVDFKKLSLNTK